jgi:hypothetical protein
MLFIHVGATHMIVADLGREGFQNALRDFRRGCKKRRLEVRRRLINEVPYHVIVSWTTRRCSCLVSRITNWEWLSLRSEQVVRARHSEQ